MALMSYKDISWLKSAAHQCSVGRTTQCCVCWNNSVILLLCLSCNVSVYAVIYFHKGVCGHDFNTFNLTSKIFRTNIYLFSVSVKYNLCIRQFAHSQRHWASFFLPVCIQTLIFEFVICKYFFIISRVCFELVTPSAVYRIFKLVSYLLHSTRLAVTDGR